MLSDLVIYSALIGNYDDFSDVQIISNDSIEQILFTDQNLELHNWKVIKVMIEPNLTPIQLQRRIKILAHKYLGSYSTSLYIDSNVIEVDENLETLIGLFIKSNYKMLNMRHPVRDCIYDEALEVARLCLEKKGNTENIIKKLKSDGYPEQNGLISGNFILRKHNCFEVINLMELWYDLFIKYAKRDQLIFNYAAWRVDYTPTYVQDFLKKDFFIKVKPHKEDRCIRVIFDNDCNLKNRLRCLIKVTLKFIFKMLNVPRDYR